MSAKEKKDQSGSKEAWADSDSRGKGKAAWKFNMQAAVAGVIVLILFIVVCIVWAVIGVEERLLKNQQH